MWGPEARVPTLRARVDSSATAIIRIHRRARATSFTGTRARPLFRNTTASHPNASFCLKPCIQLSIYCGNQCCLLPVVCNLTPANSTPEWLLSASYFQRHLTICVGCGKPLSTRTIFIIECSRSGGLQRGVFSSTLRRAVASWC